MSNVALELCGFLNFVEGKHSIWDVYYLGINL